MTGTASFTAPGYAPLPGSWDELLDDTGAVRGEWAFMSQALTEIGVPELLRRQQEARRLLEQDGVIYNVYGDGGGDGDPPTRWQLDPVPTLIGSREWEAIESGVIERAELLSMILEDLYGPRELLTKKLLPAELVFGSDGFLRACDGIRLPGAQQLFTYAADIGRDADGRPVVMADRTQAPSGAGYALQNRTVIQRVIPSLYRDSQVHRLAPFFRSLRLALKQAAPARASDDPRIVVLTPGPLNETAFEHAVLASTLGFPLVEGRDLVVSRPARVHALGRPPGARRRDPAPGRCRLVRSAGAAPRLAARRARPGRGRPRADRLDRQHARLERFGEPGADGVRAAAGRASARRPAEARRARPHGGAGRTPAAATCSRNLRRADPAPNLVGRR